MIADLALGIDVGTGGVRVACVDAGGVPVVHAAAQMAEFGANLRSPEIWLSALSAALSRLAAEVDLNRISAVSVDGTSGTVLALDQSGTPIGDALMYNDAISDHDIIDQIDAIAPQNTAARGASSALARAMVLQTRPGVRQIVHQADWIAGLIAGKSLPSDESNALKTGYDPVTRRWPAWLSKTAMRCELLPDVVAVGVQTGEASGRFGLPRGTKMIAGFTDGCASFFATGATSPGGAVTALGTTMTLKLISDQPVFAPEFGIYSHRVGDMWLAGGASNTGGGVLASFFDAQTIDALGRQIDPAQDSGLEYYPLLKPGERFPVSDPDYKPRLSPRPNNDALFLHGLLEGIARIEAWGYQRLQELGAPCPTSIRTVGGGAQNDIWNAIRARITGVKMQEADSTDAAVGVARIALSAIGA